MKFSKRLAVWAATGFGLGYSPLASGTVGTAWGVLIVWLTRSWVDAPLGWLRELGLGMALTLVAIPICGAAEGVFGKKDDGRIVADEYLTFPLCMIGLPRSPWILLLAFLSCRFMDIVKPPPARQLQSVKGGLGIVIDDVWASFYALLVNHLVVRVLWPMVSQG